jgi:hypothetical protein
MSDHTSPHTYYREVPQAASSTVGPAEPADEQLDGSEAQAEYSRTREVTLEEILGTIKAEEDRFWLRITPLTREHNRKLAVSLTIWAGEAIRIPGYLQRKFAGAKIDIAENAKTPERALYSAVVRLVSSEAAVDEDGNSLRPDHVSRTAHAMAGIAEYCKANGILIRFSNQGVIRQRIKDLTDKKLRALADAAAKPDRSDGSPVDKELGPPENLHGGLGTPECCGAIDDKGARISEDNRSGNTENQHARQPAASVLPTSGAASGCGATSNGVVSTKAVELVVKERLPLFGQLSSRSGPGAASTGIMLLVGFSDGGGSAVSLYGPIKSGSPAEKAIRMILAMRTGS